ncbi:protein STRICTOSIDINE SYNTHASE-LIKE 10-like [Solanum verrucosum]|uniref:protein STRICTOSIDINE SYNTHASE-LIKE 10-like n=1 Tax=Solanum verrucosum TaxID=315347 RepID=UPI0020D02970|nr:protein STRICTOSIDINE SYNTHASE-LIKE 10-like [Solanum verrucosum]
MEIVSITKTTLLIFQILIFLNVSPYLVHCALSRLQLPSRTFGPDSSAFDTKGGGPYTGVGDGRVMKYQGPNVGFTEFAITSPNRTKERCEGTNDPISQPTCGRPYGLGFYRKTGDLYITDAYYGLLVVKPSGGLATPLVTSFEGTPFAYLDSLDIDQERGIIYFVDSGAIFRTSNRLLIVLSGDTTGRLFKYDIATKQVTLLLDKLSGAAGVALSKDKSYLLVSEAIGKRIRRFWLKGAKANSSDVFANIDGNPDNIKRTVSGDFWVAVVSVKLKLLIIPTIISTGQRMNQSGRVVETRDFTAQYTSPNGITEVHEYNDKLYIGSLDQNFIGVDDV